MCVGDAVVWWVWSYLPWPARLWDGKLEELLLRIEGRYLTTFHAIGEWRLRENVIVVRVVQRRHQHHLCGMAWHGMVWYGVVWCGVVWCGVVWCGVVWCGVVRGGVRRGVYPNSNFTTDP